MIDEKKCKGTGKAKGYGCGKMIPVAINGFVNRVYGLGKSCKCYNNWLLSDDGKETFQKSIISGKKKAGIEVKREFNKKKAEVKTSSKNFDLYKTTAWKWCSHYVLLYYADSNNVVQCSTSPNLAYHITDSRIHVGHYIKWRDGNSTNNSTALLFENLAPQNAGDNTKLGGKPEVMEKWLIEKHGLEKIENLKVLRRQSYKLDPYTLMEISEKYRLLFNALLKERGLNNPWQT